MNDKGFSISQVLRFSWQTVQSHFGFCLLLPIAGFAVIAIPILAAGILKGKILIQSLLFLAAFPLSLIVFMGFLKIGLKLSKNESTGFGDLFSCAPLFFKFLGASILNALIVGGVPALLIVGTLLLLNEVSPVDNLNAAILGTSFVTPFVIPLTMLWIVYFSFKLNLFSYFIIDKNLGPVPSLKASFRATRGVFWDEIGFWFVLGIISYIGLLCLVIGYFVAFSLSLIASAHVYQKLQD